MVLDVIKGYLQVAEGLSDVALQRAKELAELLSNQSMQATAKGQEQVQSLGDDIMEASRTNRDLLTGLVRTEVDRAVGRMGFVREEELAAVRGHVQRLEDQLRKEHQRASDRATGAVMTAADVSQTAAKSAVGAASATVSGAANSMSEAAKTVIGRTGTAESASPARSPKPAAGKKTAARKVPAQKPAATPAAAKKAPAKKAPAKKTTAKKTPAKRTPAKKAPASKAPARKASGTGRTGATRSTAGA